ncbi:MAG: Phenylalanine--tRNA ligase alpha subunit [Candidatus Dependentiae bacterium ADurb.Bin331]|nr:MAG: Phenylalanine--tRNA ligase alpha subunit [Candidatus Dependentiae bacterium ADurb.Bin331]
MKSLQAALNEFKSTFSTALQSASDEQALEHVRTTFLSRKGHLSALMEQLKNLSIEEKRTFGPLLNELKQWSEETFTIHKEQLIKSQQNAELAKQQHFDVTATMPGTLRGSLHPLTHIKQQVENIFISMGYQIADGPEVETDYYNFESLNIPADHPARDMWDTFWLDIPSLLLRTHTSPVQVHAMEKKQLPLAVIAPGRCYRHEATDATHDFLFMQLEGLVIDTNISMSNLLATCKAFLQAIFKKDLKMRVRPSYFPFTEPSIEIDITCPFCTSGCSVCKFSRWIEICGAGLVHPRVLQAAGIDTEKYSGFAFGFGLTRLAMLTYSINDIRLLHSGKIEFLEQFS